MYVFYTYLIIFKLFTVRKTYFSYSLIPAGGVPHQKRLKALTGIELCLHYGFDTFLR